MASRRRDEIEKVTEEEGDPWNDPDILNNIDKLMSLKFTKQQLELAHATDFTEKCDIVREIVLQDPNIVEIAQKYHQVVEEEVALKTITDIEEVSTELKNKCFALISEVKNKPFWTNAAKDELLDEKNEAKVRQWIQTLELFSKKFKTTLTLRQSRKSMMPTMQSPDSKCEIIQQLGDLYPELQSASSMFDELNC